MFYLFLLAHLVADFMFQPYWLVQRKRFWHGLLIHGGIVLICMLLLGLLDRRALALWPVLLGVTAVHIAADWWKVHRANQFIRSPILAFLLDQLVHLVTLGAALSLALPAEAVWSLAGSPLAQVALYGAVYLVATCATPIAVMVWLDPTFTHAALGAQARARGALVGAGVVSLALLGGPAALPATLIGYAVVVRRPASAHPLESHSGTLAVVCVAALLGSALLLMQNIRF